VKNQKKI